MDRNKTNDAKIFIEAVGKIVESKFKSFDSDITKRARIEALNSNGTANVYMDDEIYENVKIRSGLLPQLNEVVFVSIPNKNIKDMYVDVSDNITSGDGDIVVSGDLTYIHTQIASSNSWHIIHNLNKFPSISVVDSGGNLVVGDMQYINTNEATVLFSSQFSGKAYLN